MKLKITAILIAFMVYGCANGNTKRNRVSDKFDIYEIDGCEYIAMQEGGVTHKGNCKFCLQRNNK